MIDVHFSTDMRCPVDPYQLYSAMTYAARSEGMDIHDDAFWIRADANIIRCQSVFIAESVATALGAVRRLGRHQVRLAVDAASPPGYSPDVAADVVFDRTERAPNGRISKRQIIDRDEFDRTLAARLAENGVNATTCIGPVIHGKFTKNGQSLRWMGRRVWLTGLSRADWRALIKSPIGARARFGCGVFL